MATRFSQLTPEMIAGVQAELERGRVRDFADLGDRMIQRDTDVLAAMESRMSVISGSVHVIEPAEPTGDALLDSLAVAGADFARQRIARVSTFSRFVHEQLMGIFFGFAAHEKEWTEDEDGSLWIKAFHWVHQRRFIYSDDWFLRIMDTGREYHSQGLPLDPDKWVVHEPKVIPGYPTGGALRVCMWPFLFKSLALQFWNAGGEQFAWPTPVGTLAPAASTDVEAQLLLAMENFTNGKAALLREGSTLELLESAVTDAGVNAALVAECNRGIASALLGMTDLANPGRVGSYAAVKTRKGATVDARILKDERALAATFESQIFEPMMRLNADYFGGIQPPTPRISWAIPQALAPIPTELLGVVTVDEARASIGLAPIGGTAGAALAMPRPVANAAPAQVPA